MNTKPIESANDADLRAVPLALARAAQRARELAASTGTRLVVVERGEVKLVPTTSESTNARQVP